MGPTASDRIPVPSTLDVIGWNVRRGHLSDAGRMLAYEPPWAEPAIHGLLSSLVAEGFGPEVEVLRACRRDPSLPDVVERSRRTGPVAGMAIGMALAVVVGPLALLPGLVTVLLAREAALELLGRPARDRHGLHDRSMLRLLSDHTFYLSPALKVTPAGSALLALVGAAVVAGGIGLHLREPAAATYVLAVSGSAMVLAGVLARSAALRLRHAGLRHGQQGRRRARTTTDAHATRTAPITPITPITIKGPRDRLHASALIGPALTVTMLAATRPTAVPVLAALAVLLTFAQAAALGHLRRAVTSLTIDEVGVVERGLIRTRRHAWGDIHALRDHEAMHRGLTLVLADSRRRVVAESRLTEVQKMAIEETAGRLARAPDPGVSPSDRRFRLAFIVFLAVVMLFTTALLLIAVLTGIDSSIDPAVVPPGHPYTVSTTADGQQIASVECPPLSTWVTSSDRDPLCARSSRTAITFAAGALTVDAALVAGIIGLQRSRRRTTRSRREVGSGLGR